MKKILFLSFIVLAANFCAFGKGDYVKQERKTEAFEKLEVNMVFRVYLSQGDVYSVVLEAEEKMLDIINTEVTDGKLKVWLDEPSVRNFKKSKSPGLYITVPRLSEIKINGVCDVSTETRFVLENDLKINLNGVSKMEGDITAPGVEVHVAGVSKIKLTLNTERLYADIFGKSKADFSGIAENQNLRASGVSKIDASELSGKSVSSASSGISSVKANKN